MPVMVFFSSRHNITHPIRNFRSNPSSTIAVRQHWSSPVGWLRMRVWRMSLWRTKSTIVILWDGSFDFQHSSCDEIMYWRNFNSMTYEALCRILVVTSSFKIHWMLRNQSLILIQDIHLIFSMFLFFWLNTHIQGSSHRWAKKNQISI